MLQENNTAIKPCTHHPRGESLWWQHDAAQISFFFRSVMTGRWIGLNTRKSWLENLNSKNTARTTSISVYLRSTNSQHMSFYKLNSVKYYRFQGRYINSN
ncbi:hypothetical protein ILYODFUR_021686 [Ilyodon furcidens]|uniref:Uncharacterized protein n=1 Tax=Ilyodon furcidens TaxID=33524 RepID=A0ABV0TBF6_9TELE